MRLRELAAKAVHAGYKGVLSPLLHAGLGLSGACRSQPTCSEYAAIALARHGLLRGGLLSLWRLLRCQPMARGGFDPVPERTGRRHAVPATMEVSHPLYDGNR